MKFTLEASHLLNGMKQVSGAIEKRSTIPILSNVVVTAAEDVVILRGTDLDLEITVKMPATVEAAGSATAPVDRLRDFIAKMPKGAQVGIEQDGGRGDLKVVSGRSRMALRTLPVEDYPILDAGDPEHTFTLSAARLAALFGQTRFAISTEETRFYLNGVYLHAAGDKLRAVATDGHRLAKVECGLPDGADGIPGVIVPRKTVGLVLGLCDGGGNVTVGLTAQKIALSFGGVTLVSKLIDGTFPDYERVIPVGNNVIAIADRAGLSGSIDRVSSIAVKEGRATKLTFDAGKLVLSVVNHEFGSASDEIDVDYDAPALDIGFNARYLADILGTIANDKVRIELADAGSPTVISGVDDRSALFVIMPLRV